MIWLGFGFAIGCIFAVGVTLICVARGFWPD